MGYSDALMADCRERFGMWRLRACHDLFAIRNIAFTRILLDQVLIILMTVFTTGLRNMINLAKPDFEWVGSLLFGAAIF